MSCPFYGNSASRVSFGLIASGGNQCAIIVDSYAPCVMEVAMKKPPDAATCPLLKIAARARERGIMNARLREEYEALERAKGPE